jgi:hypothetical protein
MMIARLTRCRQWLVHQRVVTECARNVVALGSTTDGAATFDVQAKFKAPRTKAQTPIERPLDLEIVPFNADPEAIEIAVQLPPTVRNLAPGATSHYLFIYGTHSANFTSVAAANASQV